MKKIFIFTALIFSLFTTVLAQEETEPAPDSELTRTKFPAGALRVLPSSVPVEVNQGLEKLIEAGEGKLVRGDTEVIAWTGAGYKKSNAANLMRQLEADLKAKGWIYAVEGIEGELTFFTALKENPIKRAIVGYFVLTDETLLLAWTEALPAKSVLREINH